MCESSGSEGVGRRIKMFFLLTIAWIVDIRKEPFLLFLQKRKFLNEMK